MKTLEEIYTYDDDEKFYVGYKLRELENFYIYELVDERGRFVSLTLIGKAYLTKTVSKSEYLSAIQRFIEIQGAFYDPLQIVSTTDWEDFQLSDLVGKLVMVLYDGEEDWQLTRVSALDGEILTLADANSPIGFNQVDGIKGDLRLQNFVLIDFASVDIYLHSRL